MAINENDFLNELDFCLEQNDIVKAKALLQFASDSDLTEEIQKKALRHLAKGSGNIVFPLLEYLTRLDISSPEIQESIYELILDKAYGNSELLLQYLQDEGEKKTRLHFLRAIGDLMLVDSFDTLTSILSKETDKDIVLAAITSLGQLQLPQSLEYLTMMAKNSDMDIKRTSILAISGLTSPDAVEALSNFIGTDEETNKLALETMAEIQNMEALEKITSLLGDSDTQVRDTAIDQLMRLGTKATPIITKAFRNAEADYLVHLITTLGYIGDPAAIPSLVTIINTQPKDANIRQAAYEAMERIPSPKTAICLAQGLNDSVEAVRMSAARAIDKNLSKPLVAGLKNIIREESSEALSVVATLIDSDASNVFRFISDEPAFIENAKQHLATKAAPATRKAFLEFMEELGHKDLAADLSQVSEPVVQDADPNEIVVIDDSKMMLKLYQNKLSAMGYFPKTFHLPEEAIAHILKHKPRLIITDLNMPNINGLELTREVRKQYNKTDLPVLMITTQSDFTEDDMSNVKQTEKSFSKSGINQILYKPFSDEQLKKTVINFLKK